MLLSISFQIAAQLKGCCGAITIVHAALTVTSCERVVKIMTCWETTVEMRYQGRPQAKEKQAVA